MVRGIGYLIGVLALLSGNALANTTQGYSADSLRKRLEQSQANQETAANRLKAAQADPTSIKLLTDREIVFKLPNGTYVDGILLQTGKVAPAIRDASGHLQPACVTSEFVLIPGEWHSDQKTIVCTLEQHQTLAVINEMTKQVAVGSTEPEVTAPDSVVKQVNEFTQGVADKYGLRKRLAVQASSSVDDGGHASPDRSVNTGGHQKREYQSTRSESPRSATAASGTTAGLYIPPDRGGNTANISAASLSGIQKKFGISMGTWMKVSLTRNVSSAESGQIEFTLEETILGRYKDLPAGTVFFANKSFNSANKRLESLVITALLPTGEEYQISAQVYELDQTAGLSGTIERDREAEVLSLSKRTALSTLAAITPEAESVAGSAVSNLTDGMIGTEKDNVERAPRAVIRVNPQRCLMKVIKSF